MKRKYVSTVITAMLVLITIPAGLLFISCRDQGIPAELTGEWTGTRMLTVRTSTGLFSFQFTKSPEPVAVHITIEQDGVVEGTIGDANLKECKARRNRGWLGRQLNMKTDYIITGKLNGAIFEDDPEAEKQISIPFNLVNNQINVSIFQKKNGVYPMTRIQLTK